MPEVYRQNPDGSYTVWNTEMGIGYGYQTRTPPRSARPYDGRASGNATAQTQQSREAPRGGLYGDVRGGAQDVYGAALGRLLEDTLARNWVQDKVPNAFASLGQKTVSNAARDAAGGLMDQLAAFMGGGAGGGGGGGGGRVSLPRMSGPSDQEVNSLIQNLVNSVVAPLDAARTELGNRKNLSAAEIAAATTESKQAMQGTNAETANALKQIAAQQMADAKTLGDPAKAQAASAQAYLQSQGMDSSPVAADLAATLARQAASAQADQALMAQQQATLQQLGSGSLRAADLTSQAGRNTLQNTFSAADTALVGQRAQAESQARSEGERWRMELQQRIMEQNADLAAREASINADLASGGGWSSDPLEAISRTLEMQDLQRQLALQADPSLGSMWDWSKLPSSSEARDVAGLYEDWDEAMGELDFRYKRPTEDGGVEWNADRFAERISRPVRYGLTARVMRNARRPGYRAER